MNEVSVRVLPVLIDRLTQRGIDVGSLFEGLRVRPEDIAKGTGRFDWDDFARFLGRAGMLLGDPAELHAIGVRFKDRSEVSPIIPIFGLALRPRMLVEVLIRWWGPMLFTCVRAERAWLGARVVELTLTIPPEFRDSPEFFHINTGAFTGLGIFSAGVPAKVDLQLSPRRGVYRVEFPQRPSLRRLALMASAFVGGESALMTQLMQQQTELNAALAELQQKEEQYRLLVENSVDVIWRYDLATGAFSFASRAIESLLGYAPEQIKGLRLSHLVHPDDLPRIRQTVVASASGAADGFAIEVRMLRRDGRPVWVEVRVSPQRGVDGDVVALQGVTRDVSARRQADEERMRALVAEAARQELEREVEERRRVEAQLLEAKEAAEASTRLKSSILANLSHEIRTPLTGLIGFAQILGRTVKGSPAEDQARIIYNSGRRLLGLLDNMLELSRADAGKLAVEPRPYALATVVTSVTTLMGPHAAEKGVGLSVAVPDTLFVLSDARRDEQVLLNVIGNAIRYSDTGTVSVWATACDEGGKRWVEVVVADAGIGISPEFLPYVFDEFRQERADDNRRHEGSGLGLALAKRFVERVGGAIAIASAKGQGTTVRIKLPAADVA